MKVIFMGTPDFAVPALKAIALSEGHEVVAVFTQRPKPKGRGLHESKSPIQVMAEELKIPVYTPKTLKSTDIVQLIDNIEADVIVVVAYGFIIPATILNLKKYKCLNIHPSILPKFRGPAPLQWTIINGESETAVCIMQMDDGVDTGDIFLSKKLKFSNDITIFDLHDQCANLGAELIVHVLNNIETIPKIPQSQEGVSHARKLSKQDGKIIWNRDARAIECQIRGMAAWPGTFFECLGQIIKVLEAEVVEHNHNFIPGEIVENKGNLLVACGKNILKLRVVQLPGSKAVRVKDFLLGYNKLNLGLILD